MTLSEMKTSLEEVKQLLFQANWKLPGQMELETSGFSPQLKQTVTRFMMDLSKLEDTAIDVAADLLIEEEAEADTELIRYTKAPEVFDVTVEAALSDFKLYMGKS